MFSKYSNNITTVILLAIGISIASLVAVSNAVEEADLSVETSVGLIRGLQADDGDYSMFLGIKYAEVNRSNPFGPPIPITYFVGGFDAFYDSSICPQEEEFNLTIVGNLDCLDLNIYVPNPVQSTNKLSVMFYLYGGMFQLGYAGRFLYGPKFLVRHDVILVTVNYRLGPYGFLNLNTPENPGNQGLKDQLLALRWIKQNIQYFGGNPDDITLIGNSAGANSVDFHMYADYERLYDKIIMQSPTVLTQISSGSTHRDQLFELAEYFGLQSNNTDEAIAFLASIDELSVIKAVKHLDLNFNPTVERDVPGEEKFISNYTIFNDIPKAKNTSVLIGFSNGEGDNLHESVDLEQYKTWLPVVYNGIRDEYLEDISSMFRKFYTGDETELNIETRLRICDFLSDLVFIHPITRSINKYMKNGAKNVYQYYNNYVGKRNFIREKDNINTSRAIHADELGYLFDLSYMASDEITFEDQVMIDRMTTLWTNFAKYGDPTPTLTELLPTRWLPVTSENAYYYTIDTEVSLGSSPLHNRMAFWDLFHFQNEKYQSAYYDII